MRQLAQGGLDAQPRAAGHGVVPRQGSLHRLAHGRAALLRPSRRRGHGQQRRQLAVGGRDRRRYTARTGSSTRPRRASASIPRARTSGAGCRSSPRSRAPAFTSRGRRTADCAPVRLSRSRSSTTPRPSDGFAHAVQADSRRTRGYHGARRVLVVLHPALHPWLRPGAPGDRLRALPDPGRAGSCGRSSACSRRCRSSAG